MPGTSLGSLFTVISVSAQWEYEKQITDDELTKELVTKGKLRATEERLRGEIKSREERLRREIHKWRADTIKWMFIFWIGQIAALTAIIKLMLKWR